MIPGLDKIDRYIACFLPDEKKDTKEWISYILTGETILNPAEFVKKIGELLTSYGQEWKKLFFSILLLFLVSAMLSSFMEAFKSAGSAKAAKLLFLLCELVIVIRVWKGIEEKYPETKVWELVTPYFEKRNINFYVNKCGFKIVEFFNKYHQDPHLKDSDDGFKEEFFRFEKVMK